MISSRRHFVYKKAPSIKNIMAQVSSRRPLSPYPILWRSSVNWKGCFSPKRKMCPYVHRQKLSTDLNGKEYFISKFFTCSTEFELYGLTCPYSFLYMGRTMRARFVDHQKLIKDGNVDHDVPRHFAPPPTVMDSRSGLWSMFQVASLLLRGSRDFLHAKSSGFLRSIPLHPKGFTPSYEVLFFSVTL